LSSLIQIFGALLVLAAFALAQARIVRHEARSYLVLNLVGGSVLAVDAYIRRQWGFLLLEGVWAIIAAWGFLRQHRRVANPSQPGRTTGQWSFRVANRS
jgi:hypothetical protein